MFERFTTEAREVVKRAQEEARGLSHSWIGTEHLLLALLADGSGPAAWTLRDHGLEVAGLRNRITTWSEEGLDPDALAAIGIDLDEVKRATEASFGSGALAPKPCPPPKGHIPFTKRAKKTLELSLRESLRLKHKHIGAGHILLGLLREGEGMATRVMVDAGVDLVSLRADVTRHIASEAA